MSMSQQTTQQTTRRRFLQGVAAAGAASILLPSTNRAFGYQSPNDRPVFATIGLRNQGWAITQKSFQVSPISRRWPTSTRKCSATNVEKTEQKQGKKPDAYKDYRKVLDRKDIDAVMIATPDHWHTKIAVEAMYAGKDVYCEKPLTLTIDEGKLIEKVVKETGRVFQVGTMQRTEVGPSLPAGSRPGQAWTHRHGQESDLRHQRHGAFAGHSGCIPFPKNSIGSSGSDRHRKSPIERCPKCEKATAAACRCTATATTRSAIGTNTPAENSPTGAPITSTSPAGPSAPATRGPSKVTPLEYTLACEYKDGYPVVHDRYNVATEFKIRADMPNDVEMIITSEGDNGILFEGTEGRFFVNRGKIAGKPVEDLKDNPLPEGAIEEVYGGKVSENHTANFIEGMKSRKQPISDVWSHNRMLEICHLSNIAMRLGRELKWDPGQARDRRRRPGELVPRSRKPQGLRNQHVALSWWKRRSAGESPE